MKDFYYTIIVTLMAAAAVQAQSLSNVADLIRQGRMEEARTFVQRVEDEGSDPEAVLFLKGMLATDGETGADYYQQLLRDHPRGRFADDALLKLAQIKYAQGLYRSAKTLFHLLVREFPRSSHQQASHYWIGMCHLNTEQPDSAAIFFRMAADDSYESEVSRMAADELRSIRTRKPDRDDADTPLQHFAVQVGAFANQTNALLRKSYFEQRGHHVELRTKTLDGTTLYLVWVGSVDSRDEAYQLGEQLKRKYGVQYTIVSE